MTVGENIKKIRREANMTQKELADKLYISDKMVSRWESDKNLPDIEVMNKLCEIFDKKFEDFFDKKTEPKIYKDAVVDMKNANIFRLFTLINIGVCILMLLILEFTYIFIDKSFHNLDFSETHFGGFISYFIYVKNSEKVLNIVNIIISIFFILSIVSQVVISVYYNGYIKLISNNEVLKKIKKKLNTTYITVVSIIIVYIIIASLSTFFVYMFGG